MANSMLRLKPFLTLLAFSLTTFSQLADINILHMGRSVLDSYDSRLPSVEEKKNPPKQKLDFIVTLQREVLTSKRSNNNPKISFFVGSGAALLNNISGKCESTIASDEALCLTGFTIPILSRSPPLTV